MTGRARRAVAGAVIGGIVVLPATPALGQPSSPPALLQGTFQMSGTVIVANNVRGEHAGEAVQRTWTFTPLCPAAPCATVRLVRTRAHGTDNLILHRIGPGRYVGAGRFYAPLRCAGRIYRPGQAVSFRIKVHVTGTGPGAGGTTVVTRIRARYVNRQRLNLTPCIGLLGHDAARYAGQLVGG